MMMLYYCALFCLLHLIAHSDATVWSLISMEDILKEMDRNGGSEIDSIIRSVESALESNPKNVTALNLMGVLRYRRNSADQACTYFQQSCELDNYQTIEYIENWLSALRAIDLLSVVKPIQAALIRRREEDNTVLMQELINAFSNTRGNETAYGYLRTVLRESPQIYHLWVLFADLHLQRYFMQRNSNVGHTLNPLDSYRNDSDLIFYGLTLFPRCPELLFLRSMHYLHDGHHICAQYFAKQAAEVRHLDFGLVAARHYDRLFQALSEMNIALQVDAVERECAPVYIRHTVAGYQALYATLAGVAHLDNAPVNAPNPGTGTTANSAPRGQLADSVFELRYQNEPEIVAYLPSLQVGCNLYTRCVKPGFFIADAMVAVSTHFVTQAYDLWMLQSASFGLVYSSHTLEHLSHNNPPPACATYPHSDRGVPGCFSEVDAALAEWRRVLVLGGQLRLSVPDLSLLAQYFVHPRNDRDQRSMLSKMIYGGQVDQFDFHKAGFCFESLQELLLSHGFCNVTKVKDLGMFYDASIMNVLISLSVFATAC